MISKFLLLWSLFQLCYGDPCSAYNNDCVSCTVSIDFCFYYPDGSCRSSLNGNCAILSQDCPCYTPAAQNNYTVCQDSVSSNGYCYECNYGSGCGAYYQCNSGSNAYNGGSSAGVTQMTTNIVIAVVVIVCTLPCIVAGVAGLVYFVRKKRAPKLQDNDTGLPANTVIVVTPGPSKENVPSSQQPPEMGQFVGKSIDPPFSPSTVNQPMGNQPYSTPVVLNQPTGSNYPPPAMVNQPYTNTPYQIGGPYASPPGNTYYSAPPSVTTYPPQMANQPVYLTTPGMVNQPTGVPPQNPGYAVTPAFNAPATIPPPNNQTYDLTPEKVTGKTM